MEREAGTDDAEWSVWSRQATSQYEVCLTVKEVRPHALVTHHRGAIDLSR